MEYKVKTKIITVIACIMMAAICLSAATMSVFAAHGENNSTQNEIGKNNYYIQSGYYQEPFVIEMKYNLSEKERRENICQIQITLEDKTDINVCFDEKVKKYAEDKEALQAVKKLLEKIREDKEGKSLLPEKPLIKDMEYVPLKDVDYFAQEYYEKEELNKFCAVFPVLDVKQQENFCTRSFEEDNIGFFACTISEMKEEVVEAFIEKAQNEEKIDFFAIAADYLPSAKLKKYAEKYYKQNEIDKFIIVIDSLSADDIQAWLKRAKQDGKQEFSIILEDIIE